MAEKGTIVDVKCMQKVPKPLEMGRAGDNIRITNKGMSRIYHVPYLDLYLVDNDHDLYR